jgi:hypothetical protein
MCCILDFNVWIVCGIKSVYVNNVMFICNYSYCSRIYANYVNSG